MKWIEYFEGLITEYVEYLCGIENYSDTVRIPCIKADIWEIKRKLQKFYTEQKREGK